MKLRYILIILKNIKISNYHENFFNRYLNYHSIKRMYLIIQ